MHRFWYLTKLFWGYIDSIHITKCSEINFQFIFSLSKCSKLNLPYTYLLVTEIEMCLGSKALLLAPSKSDLFLISYWFTYLFSIKSIKNIVYVWHKLLENSWAFAQSCHSYVSVEWKVVTLFCFFIPSF